MNSCSKYNSIGLNYTKEKLGLKEKRSQIHYTLYIMTSLRA